MAKCIMNTKDIFLEICSYLPLTEIIMMEQLSKAHRQWIRNHHWMNMAIKTIDSKYYNYVLENYSFKNLNLSCTAITDEIVKKLENLHTLNLTYCFLISDESVKCLGKLYTLFLCGCSVTIESVKYLGKLHTLGLYDCSNINDESMKYLTKINTLDISKTNVTDKGLDYLDNVFSLRIFDCKKISKSKIQEVQQIRNKKGMILLLD